MSSLTIRPKQSLGQNFLVDGNIVCKILDVIAPNPDDIIVEIGPGFGVLTVRLVERARRVIAVEIDHRLADKLRTKIAADHFELIKADFLKYDFASLPQSTPVRVVGNIPYHITSPVIFKVFEQRDRIRDMTLMIQREVAERIVAHPKSKAYGILSVYSQLYAKPDIRFVVSRNVFSPRPDVDSAVVQWDFTRGEKAVARDPDLLDRVIHLAFQQRRKMLRRSLRQLPNFSEVAGRLDFDFRKRPEELDPVEFLELSNRISAAWKN